ncbi:MAG: TonB family protein [Candidatus Binatia bacterium]
MIDLWHTLAASAPSLLQTFLQNELQITVIILIVLSVDKLFSNAPSAFRYGLWLIGLARALWPPWLGVPAIPVVAQDLIAIPQLPTLFSAASPVQSSQPFLTLSQWLVVGWVSVSVILAVFFTTRFVAFQWRLRFPKPQAWDRSRVIPNTDHRWPPVYVTDRLESPATVGLIRPRIYLSLTSVKSNPGTLRAILHHELAHVRRKDGWASLLQGLALVLHPLNPLVWLMNKRLSDYREQSCDDFALRETGMDSGEYGHMLLARLRETTLPVFVFQSRTCFLQTKKSLIHRFLYLKKWQEGNMKVPTPRRQVILMAGLMATMVFMTLQCQEEASPLVQQEVPPPSPTMTKEDGPKFVPYDTPPSPVGGHAAIQKQLQYAEEFIPNGFQGTVVLQVQVLANGKTGQVAVLKNESGDPRLAQAAVEAFRHVAWNPAIAKGENVSVWVAIPANFKHTAVAGGVYLAQEDPPPPPPAIAKEVGPKFVPYDTPPSPVGGYPAIQEQLKYPEESLKDGSQGTVILQLQVLATGKTGQVVVLQNESGDLRLAQAALEAVGRVTWNPAKAKDENVSVWIAMPVNFRLPE